MTTRHLLLLTGVSALVLFLNLGGAPLWDRDEPRNAACAREMMERGDWIVPTFNAELRVLKPAMKYWLMITAYWMFGVNEFAARFWSAVFAFAGVCVTYAIGRRLFNPRAALWSALILSSNLLFLMSGHMAKIDAGLTFFSTLAMLVFVRYAFAARAATEEVRIEGEFATPISPTWAAWAMIYVAVGLAVLAKGLPGILPMAALGLFLLIVRRPRNEGATSTVVQRLGALVRPFAPAHFLRTFWQMRPMTGLVVVLAVAGPWYLLVGINTDGEFLRGFFLEHHFGRATTAMENHSGPFLLYYLGTIAVGLFPWSVFLGVQMIWLVNRLRQDHPAKAACLFLACWVGVYVVIFSCAKTKLPGYITPCFPGLALLMGALMEEIGAGVQASLSFWVKGAIVCLGVVGLGLGTGIAVAAALFVPGQEALGLIGLTLLAGAIAALHLYQRGRAMSAVASLMIASVAFCSLFFAVFLVRLGNLQQQHAVCAALHRENADFHFGAYGDFEPSWVFYAKQPIIPVCLGDNSAAPESRWKVKPAPVAEFFRKGPEQFIVTTDKHWDDLRVALPADAQVVSEIPRFLRRGRWLIIGHGQNERLTSAPSQITTR